MTDNKNEGTHPAPHEMNGEEAMSVNENDGEEIVDSDPEKGKIEINEKKGGVVEKDAEGRFIPYEELVRIEEEAFLRGRNSAIEEKIAGSVNMSRTDEEPGIESIFSFRESVWDS